MSDQLQIYQPKKPGRPDQYPYDDWFNGKPWRLWRGTDFYCTIDTMKNNLRTAAAKRDYALSLFHENHTDDGYFRQAIVIVPKAMLDKAHKGETIKEDSLIPEETMGPQ